ncbi:MAG: hypothetical protein WCI77_08010 [Candidatus Omnitrophota bacterium]
MSAPTKQEMLDSVETAIKAITDGGAVQSYSIGGRNIQRMSIIELMSLRDKLKKEIASDQGVNTRTYASFKDPS